MSGVPVLPVAETRPTDDRAGFGIDPHKAECPFCEAEATVSITIQLCHNCGRWFEATPADGASQKKAKEGSD